MNGNTEVLTKGAGLAFGVSIRAWICLFLTWTVCALAITGGINPKDLMAVLTFVLGHYFALHQQDQPKQ